MRLCREETGGAKAQEKFYLSAVSINKNERYFYKYGLPPLATGHKCCSSGFHVGAGPVQHPLLLIWTNWVPSHSVCR